MDWHDTSKEEASDEAWGTSLYKFPWLDIRHYVEYGSQYALSFQFKVFVLLKIY